MIEQEILALSAYHEAHPPKPLAVGALMLLLLPALAQSARGQVSVTGATLEVALGGTASLSRRGQDILGAGKIAFRPDNPIVCDAGTRTGGRCPSTLTGTVHFPRRRPLDCSDLDILSKRGRCLYGRGLGVDTAAFLPACAEADWGTVRRVEDEDADRWCDGSTWSTPAPSVGAWRVPMIQCGAAAPHDIFPPGGALPGTANVIDLPACSATFNNSRAWVGASNNDFPHADGTLYRCLDTGGAVYAWQVDGTSYRQATSDVGVATVCRAKQINQTLWMAPFADASDNWLALAATDPIERWFEELVLNLRNAGAPLWQAQTQIVLEGAE